VIAPTMPVGIPAVIEKAAKKICLIARANKLNDGRGESC